MGKVTVIKKSRKECKCSKCREVIPVGSTYFRGVINFHPDIVRCSKCGLKAWEVTTSDYLLAVGPILNEWQKSGMDYESINEELSSIRDDLQDRLDNMPEQLQESDTGQILQERIEGLEAACDELDSIDYDSIFSDKIAELIDREDASEENLTDEEREQVEEATQEEITSQIEEALQNVVE